MEFMGLAIGDLKKRNFLFPAVLGREDNLHITIKRRMSVHPYLMVAMSSFRSLFCWMLSRREK
jgi:hypothetical protein